VVLFSVFFFENVIPAAACINALFGQIQHARSIVHFRAHMGPSNQVQIFDFRQFVQDNLSLKFLDIQSSEELTTEQVDSLHGAISGRNLKYFGIDRCKFTNDGSLERVLSACTNVEVMGV
jgi:hypothetical protein